MLTIVITKIHQESPAKELSPPGVGWLASQFTTSYKLLNIFSCWSVSSSCLWSRPKDPAALSSDTCLLLNRLPLRVNSFCILTILILRCCNCHRMLAYSTMPIDPRTSTKIWSDTLSYVYSGFRLEATLLSILGYVQNLILSIKALNCK